MKITIRICKKLKSCFWCFLYGVAKNSVLLEYDTALHYNEILTIRRYVLPSSARVNTRRNQYLPSECLEPITLLCRVISQKNSTLTQKTTSKPLKISLAVLVFCNISWIHKEDWSTQNPMCTNVFVGDSTESGDRGEALVPSKHVL